MACQAKHDHAAAAAHDLPLREQLPRPDAWIVDRVVAAPPLDPVVNSVRINPMNAYSVDRLCITEIHDGPLWMHGIGVAGKRAREIRIALPVGARVAIVEARVVFVVALVCRKSAMGQSVAERVGNRRPAHAGTGGPVALSAGAERAARIPMPVLYRQLGEEAVAEPAQACLQDLGDVLLGIQCGDTSRGFFVNG